MNNNYCNLLFHRIKNHFSKPNISIKIYPDKECDNRIDKVKTNYTNIVIETKLETIMETNENIKN